MRWTQIVPVLMFAMLLMSSGQVAAQSSGSTGLFGNVTTGSGLSPGSSNMFGGSSTGGNSVGQGTFNPSAAGSQAPVATGFVGANIGQTGQQGFVGAAQLNANGSSQFGSGSSGMGGMGMGGMGMGGMSSMGGMGGMGGFAMGAMIGRRMGQGGFGTNSTTTTPQVRTTLTLAFEPPAVEPAQISSAIAEHLGALPALHWQSPAQVVMQGRTAILRGVVATEHDRDLAERVVRLEPSVGQVQNQLVVASRAAPKTAAPAK
ncbi:MAG: BON domain-containing protein [Thermoguttaceae bacterium]